MTPPYSTHSFSTEKHARGQWNTRALEFRNPAVRAIASYMSYKRSGVDKLAKTATAARFTLDAGAGKGAYGGWFLGRRPSARVIAADWSFQALRAIRSPKRGRVLPVCADLQNLPFKSGSIGALFSVDTLGHVSDIGAALDEFLRVCEPGSPLFVHSECGDYRTRWPDRELIVRLEKDLPAEVDGHVSLYRADELYAMYSRRFFVRSFINPAGYLGWLIGYPEKYHRAFLDARWGWPAAITAVMAAFKNHRPFNVIVRLLNALSNHSEVFFGLKGGGSCFAELKRP